MSLAFRRHCASVFALSLFLSTLNVFNPRPRAERCCKLSRILNPSRWPTRATQPSQAVSTTALNWTSSPTAVPMTSPGQIQQHSSAEPGQRHLQAGRGYGHYTSRDTRANGRYEWRWLFRLDLQQTYGSPIIGVQLSNGDGTFKAPVFYTPTTVNQYCGLPGCSSGRLQRRRQTDVALLHGDPSHHDGRDKH